MSILRSMGEMAHRIPEDAVEVTSTELRVGLRDLLERVAYEEDELVVTRAGKPIAAVVSMDAYVALRQLLRGHEEMADLRSIEEASDSGEDISAKDVLKGPSGGT